MTMKKIATILLIGALLAAVLSLSASAEATLSLSGPASANLNETFTLTLSAADLPECTSLNFTLTFNGTLFEKTASAWQISGAGGAPFSSGNYASLSVAATPGTAALLTLTLKVIKGADDPAAISIKMNATNGAETVFEKTASCSVQAVCPHTYDPAAHTHKGANCKEAGFDRDVCTLCGHVQETAIPTLPHTWNEGAVAKEANCKEEGVKTFTCTVCGETENRPIAKTAHSWGDWQDTVKATCTAEGEQTRTCTACSGTETRKTGPYGHLVENWIQTKAPTCTEEGERKGVCTREGCGANVVEPVAAKGHAFDWKVTKDATCTETGTETRVCRNCGFAEKQTRELPALGHQFKDPEIVREATLSQTGLYRGECELCGEANVEEVIPCGATDEKTGVEIRAAEGAFPEGAAFTVKALSSGDDYEAVKAAFAEISETFTAFDLSVSAGGTAVTPASPVTVSFPVPAEYGDKTKLFVIDENGAAQEVKGTPVALSAVAGGSKTFIAELSSFGRFVLADTSAVPAPSTTIPRSTAPLPTQAVNDMDGDSITSLLIISGLAVAAVVAAVFIFAKRKK